MSHPIYPELHTVRPALGQLYTSRLAGLGGLGGGPIMTERQTLILAGASVLITGGLVYVIARALMKPRRGRRRRR